MTIHDALFKATFTQPEHAAGELRHVLPADFVKMLDFATLAVEPGSYIDEALKERQSDVLLSIRTGATRTLVYVLYEHQSTVDRLMAFRLLRYMVRIWERRLRENSEAERLPPILPVVLHQSPTGWTAPVQLGELLDVEPAAWRSIKTYVPTFQFFLDDISTDTVDSIRGRAMTAFARLVLFCLRHSREPDNLLGRFDEFLDLRREVRRSRNGVAALTVIWHYLARITDAKDSQTVLERILRTAAEEERAEIVNGYDLLMEQGELRYARRMLTNQLTQRFGALPPAVVSRLEVAELPALERWTYRVVQASSLAEVLDEA